MDLELWSFASAEAQVAAIADDIAYDAHDIDDGLRAELFALDDLAEVPLVGDILARHRRADDPGLDPGRVAHELVRRLITRMIEDVIAETGRRLRALAPGSADDVRGAPGPVGGFSPAMAEADRAIKGFLYPRMYRHPRIMRIMGEAEGVVCDLFERYAARPAGPAGGMGAGQRGGGRGCAAAPDRRFHRRHDRPLRADRARAAFRFDARICVSPAALLTSAARILR